MRSFDHGRIVILGAVAVCLLGCVPGPASEDLRSDFSDAEDPVGALYAATIGMHVMAWFHNGEAASGYLVARGAETFTLRGVGWQAARLTVYEIGALSRFQVSDPQPDYGDVRF